MLIATLDLSLRILAAAAAVGVVLVLLRVRSGAARHAAWSAVLLAMLTMPVLTAIVPKVDVPVPSTVRLDLGTIVSETPPQGITLLGDAGPSPGSVAPARPVAATGVHRTARAAGRSDDWILRLPSLLVVLYGVGLLVFALRLVAGWRLARRLVTGGTPAAVANSSRVLESAAVAVPLTTGVISPTILLPVTWRKWPADKLAAVLAHENAHIRRRDAVVALLAQINRAIFWFHPLAWWLERTLAVAAQYACDEAAARQLGQPRRYAEVLLDMAATVSRGGRRVSWWTIGVDGSGLLGARIDRILNGDAMARMSSTRGIGVAVGCAAVLVLAIACRQQITLEPLRPDPGIQSRSTTIRRAANTTPRQSP